MATEDDGEEKKAHGLLVVDCKSEEHIMSHRVYKRFERKTPLGGSTVLFWRSMGDKDSPVVTPLGTVTVKWHQSEDDKVYTTKFHVFEDCHCTFDMRLGKSAISNGLEKLESY